MQPYDQFKTQVDCGFDCSSTTIRANDVYSILQNERRRLIITYLVNFDVGEKVECSAVADYLESQGDNRQAAYISIIQQHAGRLEKYGLIDYDNQKKTVIPCAGIKKMHDLHRAVENRLN